MNLLQIDIKHSNLIPFVAISLLTTYLAISFFDMEMFLASYVVLAGMLFVFIFALFLIIRKRTLCSFDVAVLLFTFILEALSILNGVDWKNWLYFTLAISSYIILFNYYKEKYHILIFGILFVLSIATYCQLYQCITHPEMWIAVDNPEDKNIHGFILGGNYNQMGSRMIIALTTAIISITYSKWFWLNIVPLFICCFAILFMVQSMTALSCLFLFLFFCLIKNRRILSIGLIALYVGVLLFQVIVCFSGTGLENNELARWFVVDILEKDMTFTGRTEMWDSALRVIAESPLWGYGLVNIDWYMTHMSSRAVGAHNFILNTMIHGGIILLALYIIIIIKSLQNLIYASNICSKKMIAAFGVMSIMMLFETYETPLVFLLSTIMYYYSGSEPVTGLVSDAREQQ